MRRALRALNLVLLALNLTMGLLCVLNGRWFDGTLPLMTAFICGSAYVLLTDSIEQEERKQDGRR